MLLSATAEGIGVLERQVCLANPQDKINGVAEDHATPYLIRGYYSLEFRRVSCPVIVC